MTALLILTPVHVLVILSVFAAQGGNPMNRVGFAVFMAVLSAVITYLPMRWRKWSSVWLTSVAYVAISVAVHWVFYLIHG